MSYRKHEKTHSRPWKCADPACKYSQTGFPTEKERDRHVNDKHSESPTEYRCLFPPCQYHSKRESNCKQHMEKAHKWSYLRSKTNNRSGSGKSRERSPSAAPSNSTTEHTPTTPALSTPASSDDFDFTSKPTPTVCSPVDMDLDMDINNTDMGPDEDFQLFATNHDALRFCIDSIPKLSSGLNEQGPDQLLSELSNVQLSDSTSSFLASGLPLQSPIKHVAQSYDDSYYSPMASNTFADYDPTGMPELSVSSPSEAESSSDMSSAFNMRANEDPGNITLLNAEYLGWPSVQDPEFEEFKSSPRF